MFHLWETRQLLLHSVDVNLHISHVAIDPVVFEAHDQSVGLQTAQTDGLKTPRTGTY